VQTKDRVCPRTAKAKKYRDLAWGHEVPSVFQANGADHGTSSVSRL